MKYTTYRFEFEEIVDYIYKHKDEISSYKEANGIKMLCPVMADVTKYKSFIDRLKIFYEYDL